MFPVRQLSLTPKSYPPGDFSESFFYEWLPVTALTMVTLVTNTLALLCDWLAYRLVVHLHLADRVKDGLVRNVKPREIPIPNDDFTMTTIPSIDNKSNLDVKNPNIDIHKDEIGDHITHRLLGKWTDLYVNLPEIMLAVCIWASVLYGLFLAYCAWKLWRRQKRFRDTRDGTPHRQTVVDKYGHEGLVVVQVVLHHAPILLVLLALHGAVSCHLFIPVHRQSSLWLCVVLTMTALVWKLVVVLWSGGCLNMREQWHGEGKIGCVVVRLVMAVIILVVLAIACLNLVLLPSFGPHHSSSTWRHGLLKALGTPQWPPGVKLSLHQSQNPPNTPINLTVINLNKENPFNTTTYNLTTPVYEYTNIVDLDLLLENEQENIHFAIKCEYSSDFLPITAFFLLQNRSILEGYVACSMTFTFRFDPVVGKVYYNYGYMVDSSHGCSSGRLADGVRFESENSKSSRTPGNSTNKDQNISEEAASFYQWISYRLTDNYHGTCLFDLEYNESLPLSLCA